MDGGVPSGVRSSWYDIYPLWLPDEPIPTALEQVETDGDDVLRYYDVLGHYSSTPYNGFNIVITGKGKRAKVFRPVSQ